MTDNPIIAIHVRADGASYLGPHLLATSATAPEFAFARALAKIGAPLHAVIHIWKRGSLCRAVRFDRLIAAADKAQERRRASA
jgi:hypothetical protein